MKIFKLFLSGFLFCACIHLFVGCPDDVSSPSGNEPGVDVSKIRESADNVEQALMNADTTALKELMCESTLAVYQPLLSDMQSEMEAFGTGFQNRELLYYTHLFAVYSVPIEGENYTISFARQDDGSWKLSRL